MVRTSINIDQNILDQLDEYASKYCRGNRSYAIQELILEGVQQWKDRTIRLHSIMMNKMTGDGSVLTSGEIAFIELLEKDIFRRGNL